MPRESFSQVIALAIADIAEHGFDSEQRIQAWVQRILQAAHLSMASASSVENTLRRALTAKFATLMTPGAARKYHGGMDRFTLQRVAPAARAELDRRIVASISLIKLNREEATQKMIRRFVGWSTSVPVGGADVAKREEAKEVKKSLSQLSFIDRRVFVDQGAKLVANVNAVVAKEGGAIAAIWRHKLQTAGYESRPTHVAREGDIFLLPNTWATERGFVKPGKYGLTTSVEQPGEWIFCGCWWEYVYRLSALPDDMLTAAGRSVIAEARAVRA